MPRKDVHANSLHHLVILREGAQFFLRIVARVNGRETFITRKLPIDDNDLFQLTSRGKPWEKDGILIYGEAGSFYIYRHGHADITGSLYSFRTDYESLLS